MRINNCVVVIKETALTQSRRAARFASKGDRTARRLIRAHAEHHRTVDAVRSALRHRRIDFDEMPAHKFAAAEKRKLARADLIVTAGGDGTLLNASHYVTGGAMLGVNSAPGDSIGHFCSAVRADVGRRLDDILGSRLRPSSIARLAISIDGKRLAELALNDVLIVHDCPAATTRYIIEAGELEEEHRSSGLWVATAIGSTAGIRSAGGRVLPQRSRRIQYMVRELYREPGRDYSLVRGFITEGDSLTIASKMPEGRLYIDGARTVYRLPFGARAHIELAELSLRVFLKGRTPQTPAADQRR